MANKILSTKKELNNLPVITNVNFGHVTPIITYPIGGKINIAWVGFRPIPGFSGKTTFQLYDVYKPGAKQPYKEVVTACIFIAARLRRHVDLCKMTVYHELVHAESDMLGYRGKKNSCRKGAIRFNKRMTELARAGAFNGLW